MKDIKPKLGWQLKIFFFGLIISTLAISPLTSFEPFNIIKLVFFTTLIFILLALNINWSGLSYLYGKHKSILILAILFIFQSTLVLFISPTSWIIQFFGADGRSTGYIFYVSLMMLVILSLLLSHLYYARLIIISLIIAGVINLCYGLLQSFGLDFFNWTNPHSPVFGFFGNPNFLSSFLGIFSSVVFPFLFNKTFKREIKLVIFMILLLNFYVILQTNSIQGLVVLIFGTFLCTYLFLLQRIKSKIYLIFSTLVMLSSGLIVALDILQKLPWNSILYKDSVSYRGDLWRAALNLSKDFPLSGIGFDGFSLYYRSYRDVLAVQNRGLSTVADSSHNVFLDVLVNGGLPLLLVYITLTFLVLRKIVLVLIKSKNFDPIFISLVCGWSGYQIQSLISINQIGLAIWGWVLAGAILNYETVYQAGSTKIRTTAILKFSVSLRMLAGLLIGVLITIQPFNADRSFRTALDSRDVKKVLDSAYDFPNSPLRMYRVAELMYVNNLYELAHQVSTDAVKLFPNSFENWELLSKLDNLSNLEKETIRKQMNRIDPNYTISRLSD
jgi:O-antigen ligase